MTLRSPRWLRPVALLVVTVLATLLAGCGGSRADQPAADLLAEARRAAVEAGSVQVMGELVEDGRRVTLDLAITAGRGGRGTITQGGQTVQVLSSEDRLYLMADRAFWTEVGGTASADRFADRWLLLPAEGRDQFGRFGAFTDVESLVDQVFTPQGAIVNGGEEQVDGQSVIALRDSSQVDGSALLVAAEGEPYPVQLRGPRGSGTVTFSGWGDEVDVSPPDDPLDLAAEASAAAESSPGATSGSSPEASPTP